MASLPQFRFTLDEYLEREAKAAYKSEYYAGHIFAMAGGTETHSRLSARALSLLDRHLDGCRVYDSNLKLYIESADQCVYPDAMCVCEEPVFRNARIDVILNPTLIVEVLSPSTEKHDQGSKANDYRTIPSLKHILLISQDRVSVEHFVRKDGQVWLATRYDSREDTLPLLTRELVVGEFYRGIL